MIEEIDIFEGNENRLTFEQVSDDTNNLSITKIQSML